MFLLVILKATKKKIRTYKHPINVINTILLSKKKYEKYD